MYYLLISFVTGNRILFTTGESEGRVTRNLQPRPPTCELRGAPVTGQTARFSR